MRRAVSAVAALLSLVVFFVGSALGLLAMAGNPVPAWHTLRTAVDLRYFPPHLVVQMAACVAWPCLGYLVVAVVRMGIDAWRDRPSHVAAPVVWLQPVVRNAIAALVLFSGLLSRNPASAAPPLRAMVPAVVPIRSTAGPSANAPTYRVRPNDELWDIAGRQLGDPLQWRAIWDLNKGRDLVDVDGRQRTFEDPKRIYPGWELVLPTITPSLSPVAVSPPVVGKAPMAAEPPAATDSSPPTPPPTMVAVSSAHRSSGGVVNTAALIEAGVLSAALVSLLRVLRRRQAQHRPSGRRIRLPSRVATSTELVLRTNETPDRVVVVQRAMSWLSDALPRTPDAPVIQGLVVDDCTVEVLVDHPAVPPAPWVATSEGFRWRALASELIHDSPVSSVLLPSLVSFGRVAAGAADAFMNLEAGGFISVNGDPAQAVGFLFSLATQLVAMPWAEAVNVVLVALPAGLAGRDTVRQVATVSAIGPELQTTADIMQATARQCGCEDLFEARIRGEAGDGWPPTVVLCGRRPSADELQLLVTVAQPGSGVAAVVANAGSSARWQVDVTTSPCPVHPLRVAIEPVVLDESTVARLAELVETAEDDTGVTVDCPPYDRLEVSVERAMPAGGNGTIRARLDDLPDFGEPPILVRVLGSVEIDGVEEFKRAKSRELVVYLAMHPNGVGEAELDEALWSSATGRTVLPSTRDSTVSVARTTLGGAARLLPAQGQGREKRYQLGPDVQSDWSQFCALHRVGRQHDSTVALRRALELVRGRPFEAVMSGRTYGWIHTEGHGRHIEAEVADAADLAARLFLEAGNPLGARWAARRGLLAEPYTERLWVRLMEAADALGESQEIERIMDEMDIILELNGDFTGLHPNTLAVYDRLSRRHRFPAGA